MPSKDITVILDNLIKYYSDLLYSIFIDYLIDGTPFNESHRKGNNKEAFDVIFSLFGRDFKHKAVKKDYSKSIAKPILKAIIENYKTSDQNRLGSNELLEDNSQIVSKAKEALQLLLYLENLTIRIVDLNKSAGDLDKKSETLLESLKGDFVEFTKLFQIVLPDINSAPFQVSQHNIQVKDIIKPKLYDKFLKLNQLLRESGFVSQEGKWKGTKSSFATFLELLVQNHYFVGQDSRINLAPKRSEIKKVMESFYLIEINTLFEKKKLKRFFAQNVRKFLLLDVKYYFPRNFQKKLQI